ncbi:omptin family outer membrane protease [Devosia sp. PTR5]|uniref:Omptin family outer membrane protease n=1 Tax=Devosia oryzisoli TaxID=2774138 RepID=A0A927FXJ5_9HYPH|nr:omptin family outer membrane protease [Devosia oryzisoli]MBD8066643.1 omptin family outer membrane protease [Devosia oryzisoli]
MRTRTSPLMALALGLLAAAPAAAGDLRYGYAPYTGPQGFQPRGLFYTDQREEALPRETITLRGSIGAMYLRGDEYVFNGDRTLSQLIWESKVPVLRGGADLALGGGFSVSASGAVAGFGSSYMEDYDWFIATDNFDDWTHRSQHPDTRLDHYISLELTGGYEVARTDTAFVRAHAGARYTDLQWAAFGGSYIYSSNTGFRDTSGSFADGDPGITYRQQLPELFVGVDGEERYGRFTLGGLLRGGLIVGAVATDDHWMRDLRFTDSLYAMPSIEVGLSAGYAMSDHVDVTLGGNFRQIFQQRGDTKAYNTVTGATDTYTNAAGASLRSVDITAGLTGRF